MGSVTVLVTVRGSQGAIDLELPADAPVRDLLPLVVAVCASPVGVGPSIATIQWALGRLRGAPFSAERSLMEYEVMDGAILLLREAASWDSVSSGNLSLAPDDAESPSSDLALGGIGIRWNKQGLLS